MLDTPSECHIEISGPHLAQLSNESGGHRLQRIPPTERKGRVHTSTVTVAVIDSSQYALPNYSTIDPSDLKMEWYSGTGAGGQHRNKHQNSIRLTHIPTGHVETAQCRSREASKKQALDNMIVALQNKGNAKIRRAQDADRKSQVGSGMRGDKIRTYRFQDDIATDHRTAKKVSLAKVMAGNFDLLW